MGGLTAKKGLPSPLSKFGCMILYTKPICPWPYGTGLWPWSGPDLAWIWPRSGTDRLVGVSRCQGSCARPSKWSTERTVTWGENKSSGHVDTKSLHRPAVRVAHHLEVHLWSPALSIWNEKKKTQLISPPLHLSSTRPIPTASPRVSSIMFGAFLRTLKKSGLLARVSSTSNGLSESH